MIKKVIERLNLNVMIVGKKINSYYFILRNNSLCVPCPFICSYKLRPQVALTLGEQLFLALLIEALGISGGISTPRVFIYRR